jgi:hypothetical protein
MTLSYRGRLASVAPVVGNRAYGSGMTLSYTAQQMAPSGPTCRRKVSSVVTPLRPGGPEPRSAVRCQQPGARGVGKLRTKYGPRPPYSVQANGQQWTPAASDSRSTTADARPGGQGVASSNLASPTSRCRMVMPDQSRIHPATGPSSTNLSAEELGPDWAHQREYASPTSRTAW